MEFLIQQMKSHKTFSSFLFFFFKWPLPWHENKIAIFMLAQNEIVLS